MPNEDRWGDACDGDTDNDGLPDVAEKVGCGSGRTDAGVPVLDKTYDDHGDGNPVPPMGTDLSDDGPSWDTDGDTVLDGVECAKGSNPLNPLSYPPPDPTDLSDDDHDGLFNGWETRGWGTNPSLVDSDGDGLSDCREVGDVDGNGAATISDVRFVAMAALVKLPPTVSGDMDIDKNAAVTISDVLIAARIALQSGYCPP